MVWYAWVLVGWLAFGGLSVLTQIDKPQRSITAEGALLRLVVVALMIWAVVSLAS